MSKEICYWGGFIKEVPNDPHGLKAKRCILREKKTEKGKRLVYFANGSIGWLTPFKTVVYVHIHRKETCKTSWDALTPEQKKDLNP